MSYASTSSPFASVKGPSLFSHKTWAQSGPTASTSSASPMAISPAPPPKLGSSSLPGIITPGSPTPQPTSLKRTGFEAFSPSSSPFGTAVKQNRRVAKCQVNIIRTKHISSFFINGLFNVTVWHGMGIVNDDLYHVRM